MDVTRIGKYCGYFSAECDAAGGFYISPDGLQTLDKNLANFENLRGMFDAKVKEFENLNKMLADMKQKHEQELADAASQYKKEKETLEAQFGEASNEAIKKSDNLQKMLDEKSDEIKQLKEEMAKKEQEIEALSKATQQQPTPGAAAEGNGLHVETHTDIAYIRSVCGDNLTTAQKQEALQKRLEELRSLGVNTRWNIF